MGRGTMIHNGREVQAAMGLSGMIPNVYIESGDGVSLKNATRTHRHTRCYVR